MLFFYAKYDCLFQRNRMTNGLPTKILPTIGVKMSNLSESRPCENREVSVSLCYHNMRSHFRTVYTCIQMEFGERYRQIDLFRLASFFTFKTYLQRRHYKNQGCNVAFFFSTPFLYSLLLLFFLSFSFVSVILSLQQAKKGILALFH